MPWIDRNRGTGASRSTTQRVPYVSRPTKRLEIIIPDEDWSDEEFIQLTQHILNLRYGSWMIAGMLPSDQWYTENPNRLGMPCGSRNGPLTLELYISRVTSNSSAPVISLKCEESFQEPISNAEEVSGTIKCHCGTCNYCTTMMKRFFKQFHPRQVCTCNYGSYWIDDHTHKKLCDSCYKQIKEPEIKQEITAETTTSSNEIPMETPIEQNLYQTNDVLKTFPISDSQDLSAHVSSLWNTEPGYQQTKEQEPRLDDDLTCYESRKPSMEEYPTKIYTTDSSSNVPLITNTSNVTKPLRRQNAIGKRELKSILGSQERVNHTNVSKLETVTKSINGLQVKKWYSSFLEYINRFYKDDSSPEPTIP